MSNSPTFYGQLLRRFLFDQNSKPKLWAHKSWVKRFGMKKLLVKCLCNCHLKSIFTFILWATFTSISFCQKNYKPSLWAHKDFSRHFLTKKFIVKNWWNFNEVESNKFSVKNSPWHLDPRRQLYPRVSE